MMPSVDIEDLKALLAKVEPGPWKLDDWAVYIHIGDTDQKVGMVRGYGRLRNKLGDDGAYVQQEYNGKLLALAPELAARVIELEKERDEARRYAEEWRTAYRNKLEALGIEYADKHKHLMPWEVKDNENTR